MVFDLLLALRPVLEFANGQHFPVVAKAFEQFQFILIEGFKNAGAQPAVQQFEHHVRKGGLPVSWWSSAMRAGMERTGRWMNIRPGARGVR